MTASRVVAAVVASVLVNVGSSAVPTAAQTPRLVIISPRGGDYVSDKVSIEIRLEPAEAASGVSEYVYYADGREVCRVAASARPACQWDAGAVVMAHQLRVVATLVSGGRLVATTRTSAIDVAEAASVRVVQVPVVVTDRDGSFVSGLPQGAFTVREDGAPQVISHFSDETSPLEIVLAVDVSQSMDAALRELKRAVAQMVQRLPSHAAVSLLAFSDEMYPVGQQGDSIQRRLEILQNLQAFGGTALYDVIIRGLNDLARAQGRRALVVFTDGEDQSSRSTRAQAMEAVEASDASVYFVALGRGRALEALFDGMVDLAALSGGRALKADKTAELDARFEEVISDLSHQYLLGYSSSNSALDGRWRRIEVQLKTARNHRLRARQGYRAPVVAKFD